MIEITGKFTKSLFLVLDPVWWVRQSGVHLGRQGVAGPPQHVEVAARKSMHGLAEKI